jgi:hypothetical protein
MWIRMKSSGPYPEGQHAKDRIMPPMARCCGPIAVSFLLCGCIASKAPLFDPSKATTSVPTGEYAVQSLVYGGRAQSTVTLKISGNVYYWKGGHPFRLFEVGDGFIVVQTEQKSANGDAERYLYDLIEFRDSAYLQYGVVCADILNSFPTPESNPVITHEGYVGLVCTFSDQDQLMASLRAAAKRLRPTGRYVLAE